MSAVPINRTDWEWAILHCPHVGKVELAVALVYSRAARFETGMSCRVATRVVAAQCGLTKASIVRAHRQRLEALGWLTFQGTVKVEWSEHPVRDYWLTTPDCHPHDTFASLDHVKDD